MALIPLAAPRFGGPKRGSSRLGPDFAEIRPLLPRFGPKSGRPEVMAGWPDFLRNPDFLKKSGQISTSAAEPIFGANRLTVPRFGRPKRGIRRRGPDVAEIGPLLPRFGPKSGRSGITAGGPDFFKNPGFLKKMRINQLVGRGANFGAGPLGSAPFWGPVTGPQLARPRRRRNRASVTAIQPEIGSLRNRGRRARFC